ncbi:DUF1223 domain-containing protein [Granulicella paludicola]|uniref:DUF1223 domain-containing protein n=1 Tax=Granulicella paludicola TaxID=474951 RepID=UPI0021DF8DED|nr:DUF1223 domain-containing protein [Granulicella paludicola]
MMKLGLVLLVGSCAGAQMTAHKADGTPTPVLVELFTSEGCSSCPPADALLAKLDGTVLASGQQVIAVEEHVAYWDQLGWKDPFSSQFFSDRQNTYGENSGVDEIYTPQVVVNGVQGVLGSDSDAVQKAIQTQGKPLPLAVKVLSYAPNGMSLSVVFSASGEVPKGGAEVLAMLVDDHDSTQVQRGENAGRTLAHVSVVRSVGKGMVLRDGEQTLVKIPVSQALRAQPESGRRLVLVVQQRGQGRVIGLASEEISAEFSRSAAPSVRSASTLERP